MVDVDPEVVLVEAGQVDRDVVGMAVVTELDPDLVHIVIGIGRDRHRPAAGDVHAYGIVVTNGDLTIFRNVDLRHVCSARQADLNAHSAMALKLPQFGHPAMREL